MKKTLIALMVLAAAGGGYWKWKSARGAEGGPAYRTEEVVRGDLRITILATGVAEPQNRVELNSPVAGRIEDVLVGEGDTVARGQVLAWISSSERVTLLDAARARGMEELKRWEELYKATPLLAPLDGQIIARKLEPGQSASIEKPILVMSDRLIVKAQVDETDMARIAEKQAAEIRLDAYVDRVIPAHVAHIAYEAETVNNVTIYNVDVLPDELPDFVRSGMSASVTFVAASTNQVLLVPLEAVRDSEGGREVLLQGPSAGAPPRTRAVRLGLEDGRQAEVLDGLAEGDKVLVPEVNVSQGEANRKGTPLMPFPRGGARRAH